MEVRNSVLPGSGSRARQALGNTVCGLFHGKEES